MHLPPVPSVSMDPWCLVPVMGGENCLFGYAVDHPATGGLSWLASTEVKDLDRKSGRARTRSGRLYSLGRRFKLGALRDEGEEAWAVFHLLLADDVTPTTKLEIAGIIRGRDMLWVTCCKASRHLGVAPPLRDEGACREFMELHRERYLRLRGAWDDPC